MANVRCKVGPHHGSVRWIRRCDTGRQVNTSGYRLSSLRRLLLMRRLSDRLSVLSGWMSEPDWATLETREQVHR